jgi:hypothetical protein
VTTPPQTAPPDTTTPPKPSSPAPSRAQGQAAEAFYSCLAGRGLSVNLEEQGNGTAYVFPKAAPYFWRIPGQPAMYDPSTPTTGKMPDESLRDMFDGFAAEEGQPYRLWIDGADHSDDLRECHEPTGYAEPEAWADPAANLLMHQTIADATNAWIACARENGLPDLPDLTVTPPGSDPMALPPQIGLPLSMTPDFLSTLLAACPPVNPDRLAWEAVSHLLIPLELSRVAMGD